jgi:hypothetical protein
MSRSRRKNPVTGITLSESEKEWKQISSRIQRRGENIALIRTADGDADLPSKQAQNHWGPKDGKFRFDPDRYPKRMRK